MGHHLITSPRFLLGLLLVCTAACDGGDTKDTGSADDTAADTEPLTFDGDYSGSIEIGCLNETTDLVISVSAENAVTGDWSASVVGGNVIASVDEEGEMVGTAEADYGRGRITECKVSGNFDGEGAASGTFTCTEDVTCDGTWTAALGE